MAVVANNMAALAQAEEVARRPTAAVSSRRPERCKTRRTVFYVHSQLDVRLSYQASPAALAFTLSRSLLRCNVFRRLGAVGAVVGRLPSESQRLLAQYLRAATGGAAHCGVATC